MLPSYGSLPTTVPREHSMISRPSARALRTVLAAAALLAFASSRSHRIALRAALRASDSGADSLNLRSFSSVEARRRPFRHVVRARVAARDEATLAVRYTPLSATKLPPLWSRSINITAGTAVDVDFALARLRPNTRYRATLFAARRGAAETAWPLGVLTFASAPTGCRTASRPPAATRSKLHVHVGRGHLVRGRGRGLRKLRGRFEWRALWTPATCGATGWILRGQLLW